LAERPGWSRPVPVPSRLPGLGFFQSLEAMLGTPTLAEASNDGRPKGPFKSFGWVVLHYFRNLGRVMLTALPLMLLAGIAGAVLVEFLPWNLLNHISRVDGSAANVGVLLVAAGFGVLLP